MKTWFAVLALAAACGCSKKEAAAGAAKAKPRSEPAVAMAENVKHPLAKYIEVAGFRQSEKPGGKLSVKFVVINHSQADVADLALEVKTAACTMSVKVGSIGPEESKDVSAECITKLRVYELPDWQFVRPVFSITGPEI